MNLRNIPDSEQLWLCIRPILESFATRVSAINPSLMQSVASYSNDAFFLMAYLAFRKHNDGDDIAIAANVILANGQLTVTTDVCYGEGTILAIGPSVTFTMADVKAITANAFNAWLAEFEDFLRSKEVDVLRVASELT